MSALLFISALVAASPAHGDLSTDQRIAATKLVASMKKNPRGPYERVAWFCKDGTIQPPKSYACKERGGGVQHAVLSEGAKRLGDWGIHVGTILASVEPSSLVADNHYRARALIIERFLERSLDGWVLNAAKSYRGARQAEDEEAAARRLLEAMFGDPGFFAKRALAIRLLRALPYESDSSLGDQIRAAATVIGDDDPKFEPIRAKIHSMPEASDADRVRRYQASANTTNAARAGELADAIRRRFDLATRRDHLTKLAKRIRDKPTATGVRGLASRSGDARALIQHGTTVIRAAHRALASETNATRRLVLIDVLAQTEALWVGATAGLATARLTRSESLDLADNLLEGMLGLGLLSERETHSARASVAAARSTSASQYATGVADIARALEWARARVVSDLWVPQRRYQLVEPHAYEVIDDVLRSSALLPLAAILDRLTDDVERMRAGGHRIEGVKNVSGVRGDNPGLAIGVLKVLGAGGDPTTLKRSDIVLLREVPPDLPPVAGMITVGQESMLSHIALLAQNLGIPQMSIPPSLIGVFEKSQGEVVVLGVSVTRRVAFAPVAALSKGDRAAIGYRPPGARATLKIDEARLDLKTTRPLGLGELDSGDAGVRVGPKAAELAHLSKLFGSRVSDAVVLPFGAFVEHVSRASADKPSPLTVLRTAYGQAAKKSEADADAHVLAALAQFRTAIAEQPFPPGFEARVEKALATLGKPGTFGVFVRSDTNVEDLKDFTGAGLNLTVPNRVGLESVLTAIRAVWASPYAERSYQWRQKLLVNPEHVFPSVLLHRTVPSDKSGVLVTTDVERGGHDAFTVSTSEGVASVVDGGAAETLVVGPRDIVRLLSSSRVATRKVIPPAPAEGVVIAPAIGMDPLLSAIEIATLADLVDQVEKKFPRAEGLPWDIEFGFVSGRLYLMQIRPLKRSRAAGTHPFLETLDAAAQLPTRAINLAQEVPTNAI